eukprot:m.112757 g.112757  ORF g.112757 m.112757 type:complete len:196 (-) comp17038_c0_seq1:694-1281(-)
MDDPTLIKDTLTINESVPDSTGDDEPDDALLCIESQPQRNNPSSALSIVHGTDKPCQGSSDESWLDTPPQRIITRVCRRRTTFVDGHFDSKGTTLSLESESGKLIVDKMSHADPWPTRVAVILVAAYFAVGIGWFTLRPTELNDKHTTQSQSTKVVDAMYFIVTTLTTVGYGDVAPIGKGLLCRYLGSQLFVIID